MALKDVDQLSIQRPISSMPCEVSVAGSSCSSENRAKSSDLIERDGRFQGAARSHAMAPSRAAMIERCDRSAQNTCFPPSSMHLRRTNTSVSPMLEHDRSASSTVVQSTTMLPVVRHRHAHAIPRVHVGPQRRASRSTAPPRPSFAACASS